MTRREEIEALRHPQAVIRLVREAQPDYFTFDEWKRLDEIETTRGAEQGRPRVKFTTREQMIQALKS